VTPVGGLLIDGSLELEVANDTSGPQIEILHHNLQDFLVALLSGAVGVNIHGEGMSNSDGVRNLN